MATQATVDEVQKQAAEGLGQLTGHAAELQVRLHEAEKALAEALKTLNRLVDRVAHYAPKMERDGDLEDARVLLAQHGVR